MPPFFMMTRIRAGGIYDLAYNCSTISGLVLGTMHQSEREDHASIMEDVHRSSPVLCFMFHDIYVYRACQLISVWTQRAASGELDRGSTNSLLSLRVADVIMHSKYSNRSDSADSGRGGDHDGQFPPTLTLFLVFFF